MAVTALVKAGEYHDSIQLMLVARALLEAPGVQDSAVVMATEANKTILAAAGLLTESAKLATSNDLVVAVRAEAEPIAAAALERAEQLLKKRAEAQETGEFRPKTLRAALARQPDANVAVISVAGRYAADEARQALRRGLHVLLFSDHVSVEDEVALKEYARDHGLLLMGPGAGTAIINHVALGFANVVPAGPIGIVSAAGTGLQEVTSLLARDGVGITQGIGVGGRDLSKQVGGIMMLEALKALQQDAASEAIVLISKPPAEEVARAILAQVAASSKPTVICFLGGDSRVVSAGPAAIPARTLQEAALFARGTVQDEVRDAQVELRAEATRLAGQAAALRAKLPTSQRYVRGLFSGGTLCYEAQVVWRDILGQPVYSNAALPRAPKLDDPLHSRQHTAVDLGEEEFTSGRLHPMIDQSLRIRRLQQEAEDPEVAVVLLDVVLGYGAHPEPAAELAPAIRRAKETASSGGRSLCVVASVTGTDQDPQSRSRVVAALEDAETIVCESNAAAARLAGLIVADQVEGK